MHAQHRPTRAGRLAALLVLLAIGALAAQTPVATARPRRIAVFGSSVAFGNGDDSGREGYTGRLREMLAPDGWEVLNQSRGGDSTITAATRLEPAGTPDPQTRYLLPVHPSYVVLGLSLGNEGIRNAATAEGKDAIFKQFETGMRGFVERSRQHGIIPLLTLCYTRNDFTAVEYEYTRRMNRVLNGWDVPSVNFLGAVDDGTGKWVDGFWTDSLHPNSSGHTELAMTFVPTLFDALERGKSIPTRSAAGGFARVTGDGTAPMTFVPQRPMHPFTLSFVVRAQKNGPVAAVAGMTLSAATTPADVPGRNGGPVTRRDFTTLSAATPFTATVSVRDGAWTYAGSNGIVVASAIKADRSWHRVVLSHYTARGETLFYVDGQLAGSVRERLAPGTFGIGGGGSAGTSMRAPDPLDIKDVLLYRAAMNSDEVSAIEHGTLLQASLEIYAPLADTRVARGAVLENRAQSLSALTVERGTVEHRER